MGEGVHPDEKERGSELSLVEDVENLRREGGIGTVIEAACRSAVPFTTVGVAENIATVRAFYAAGPADDDADRYPFAAPDVVWHVPGDNPISRDYVGVHDVFETMGAAMQPLDEWRLEVVDVLGNRDLVMATVNLVARRGPHRVACSGGHVFRCNEAGKIVEAWGFVRNQAELDELFRWVPTG